VSSTSVLRENERSELELVNDGEGSSEDEYWSKLLKALTGTSLANYRVVGVRYENDDILA
jgi:hypothetical protein